MTVAAPPDEIRGGHLRLVPFSTAMITDRYLDWLADPEVNRFSRRLGRPRPSTAEALAWLRGLAPEEFVLAILDPALGHVGNIKFGPVDRENSRADLSILLGERRCWNRGLGAEAMYLVTRHLFEDRALNRVDAGSANPAFIRMVRKLGWRQEGVLLQRANIGGCLLDWTLVAQLAAEFKHRSEFEP
jgi:[ribosomal protein S5]-alanine N-acetyltransferase